MKRSNEVLVNGIRIQMIRYREKLQKILDEDVMTPVQKTQLSGAINMMGPITTLLKRVRFNDEAAEEGQEIYQGAECRLPVDGSGEDQAVGAGEQCDPADGGVSFLVLREP